MWRSVLINHPSLVSSQKRSSDTTTTSFLLLYSHANALKVRTVRLLIRSLLRHCRRIRPEHQTLLPWLGPLLPLRCARETVRVWVQRSVMK